MIICTLAGTDNHCTTVIIVFFRGLERAALATALSALSFRAHRTSSPLKLHNYDRCIHVKEFRKIFDTGRMPLLYLFIEKYKHSDQKALAVFSKGLEKDIEAVENAVSCDLSNGFVEGTISKLKMTKRVMYGRCSRELLSAKMMYCPDPS